MRWFYTLLFYLLTPLLLWRLWQRGRRAPAYRRRWLERFGRGAVRCEGAIWIHAVSVGEVTAAAPLVRRLRQLHPEIPLVVTTMTPTGSQRVRDLFADDVLHSYAPYDMPGAVARFLRAIRPRLFVIMETELWPNLIHGCHSRGIPVVLANARLSERSARGYRRIRFLAAPMLGELDWIAAQGDRDAERFIALGVPGQRVTVTGSVKFDMQLPERAADTAAGLRRRAGGDRPVWIAASTHEGEDEQVLEAHKHILRDHPDALLILVPRHPERFGVVATLVGDQGLSLALRSRDDDPAACQVLLGDTMGELLVLFGVADVAFVGGSLVRHGGHNPLEPGLWGIPVLVGPHVFNFQEICQRMADGGGLRYVGSAADLAQALESLLADEALRRRQGQEALATVEANRGALERLVSGLDHWLKRD